MTRKAHLAAALAAMAFAGGVHAATAEEAAQLGKTLTPLGAEKAGNKDGTIPAWDGGWRSALTQRHNRRAASKAQPAENENATRGEAVW